MTDREAVKLLTGLTDAELTDLGGFPGEDAFGETVLIGSEVQWLGARGANRLGTVMGMDGTRTQIRDTRGNWTWRDTNTLVVLP